MSAVSANPIAALRRRLRTFAWSRLALVLVLLAAQALAPGVAARCDLAATGTAAAAGDVIDATAGVEAFDSATASTSDDGCDGGSCVDCCLHASATLVSPPRLPSITFAPFLHRWRTSPVPHGDYPVDIRPPIAS
jgi:hypothetical protein